MKAFASVNPTDLQHAVKLLAQSRRDGRSATPVGGGSDLLGLIKERLVTPDLLVNLKAIKHLDQVRTLGDEVRIGGLITLDALSSHPLIRSRYGVLAEAAASVGTQQIRNVGTLAGNVCQRPWCWYFRGGFPCLKNGGTLCFALAGENQFHAIFGGGPSHIVHPSDTAPALAALDARFNIIGPSSQRTVPVSDFFILPKQDPARENVLAADELLAEIILPSAIPTSRSKYSKVLDRESWTHALVSAALVLDMAGDVCRSARIALGGVAPIPWRLFRVERMLAGQRITSELAAKAGEAAIVGATPLAKNGYKVALTRTIVRRILLSLAANA